MLIGIFDLARLGRRRRFIRNRAQQAVAAAQLVVLGALGGDALGDAVAKVQLVRLTK